MRVAVPLFGADISPRFCYAERALVVDVDVDRGEILEKNQQRLGPANVAVRLSLLGGLRVNLLLCGGFSRRYLPLAERLGVRVIWGLFGDAEEVVDTWLAGDELPFSPCLRPCRKGRSEAGRARGRGACRKQEKS